MSLRGQYKKGARNNTQKRHCERSEAILRPQGLTYYGQIAAPFGLAMTNLYK